MKLTDTPIFDNLCKLRRMIYDAHRYMTNADRQRFMDELLHLSGRCIEHFAEAYDFPDSRREAISRGWIELYEVVGRIDDDLGKYRAHLAQSRSASAQGAADRDH